MAGRLGSVAARSLTQEAMLDVVVMNRLYGRGPDEPSDCQRPIPTAVEMDVRMPLSDLSPDELAALHAEQQPRTTPWSAGD